MLAELAVGIAGFTGVASAFGGRDRTYAPAERVRIVGIFQYSSCVMVGSLCVLTLTGAGNSAAAVYAWASAVASLFLLWPTAAGGTRTFSLAKDPEVSTTFWLIALNLAQAAAVLGLFVGNLIVWREAWPLIAGFSLQLSWALFLFARIMTHRN